MNVQYSHRSVKRVIILLLAVFSFMVLIQGAYSFARLLQSSPATYDVFALLLAPSVFLCALLAIFAYRQREQLDIEMRISLLTLFGLVGGYWVFAPFLYFYTINIDPLQLNWVVFAFLWELPVIGGTFIIVVRRMFRPIKLFLGGDMTLIRDSNDAYRRLRSYPLVVSTLLFVLGTTGYMLGSLQLIFFSGSPLFEQVKAVVGGATASLFVAVFLNASIARVLNDARNEVSRHFPGSKKYLTSFTESMMLSMFGVIVAVTVMGILMGITMAQKLVQELIVIDAQQNFDREYLEASRDQRDVSWPPAETNTNLGAHKMSSVFELSSSTLDKIPLHPYTRQFISAEDRGTINDYSGYLKVLVFQTDSVTKGKKVIIVHLFDSFPVLERLLFASLSGNFLLFLTMLGALYYQLRSVSSPIRILSSELERDVVERRNFVSSVVFTGDEIEGLADSVRYYSERFNELNKSQEARIKEKTEQLEKHIQELERLNKFMVGREIRMKELKEEIAGLEKKIAEEHSFREAERDGSPTQE